MAEATTTSESPSPAGKGGGLVKYLGEVRAELKKAEWPTREQLVKLTQVVLTLIFIVAVYCGGLDGLLGLVTNRLFNRGGA
jgi:preprotein translocase subunit SecE